MDCKITKKRLNDHLSYDWIKYIAIILAAILFWSLILTMMKPRVPNNKTFQLLVYSPQYDAAELDKWNTRIREKLDPGSVLSVSYTHKWQTEQGAAEFLSTREVTQEFDLAVFDNEFSDDPDKPLERVSTFKGYVDRGWFTALDDALAECEKMLSGALNASGTGLTEAYTEEFRKRVKQERKFNKIDTEEDFAAAVIRETERLQGIRDNAHALSCYLGLKADPAYPKVENLAFRYVRGTQLAIADPDNYTVPESEKEKIWGINLSTRKDGYVVQSAANLSLFNKEDEDQPRAFALGLAFFSFNLPYAYEYFGVLNDLITRAV